ncbi:1817_t:CDS:2, partial [Acaulospora colombiana]
YGDNLLNPVPCPTRPPLPSAHGYDLGYISSLRKAFLASILLALRHLSGILG